MPAMSPGTCSASSSSTRAEGLRCTINLVTPDNGETFIVEMENATLTNIAGFQAAAPDLTLTINRADLEQTMMDAKTLDAEIADGTAKAPLNRRRTSRGSRLTLRHPSAIPAACPGLCAPGPKGAGLSRTARA
jgi:alkyl sulfatase BDS1-like metallo-beta-lactamase superfamily hydrolase